MADEPKAGSVCEHKNLRRSCPICEEIIDARIRLDERRIIIEEKDATIAALRAENAELRARVESDLMQQNATAKTLRAELAAIKAQASDATEYVLAVENRELRAEVERLKQEAAQWKDLHDSCHPSQERLRAELAQAKEEIERGGKLVLEAGGRENGLRADLQQIAKLQAAEKAARAEAEARVKVLEDHIVANGRSQYLGPNLKFEARAILAARKAGGWE